MADPQNTSFLERRLLPIALRFWPELEGLSRDRRLVGVADVLIAFLMAPLAIIGLFWLINVTQPVVFARAPGLIVLLLGLAILFELISYFLIVELRPNRYGSSRGSLTSIVIWAAVFLVGANGLWIAVLIVVGTFVINWRQTVSRTAHWTQIRDGTQDLVEATLVPLLALTVYAWAGGEIPLSGLDPAAIFLALLPVILNFMLAVLLWIPYLLMVFWIQRILTGAAQAGPLLKFFLISFGLGHLANPFGILAAGLFVESGLMVFLFFMGGMLLVAYAARRFSWVAESNRQTSSSLERLEALGRSLINAHPDGTELAALLAEHVPNMFPAGKLAIWRFPDQILFKYPDEWQPALENLRPSLEEGSGVVSYLSKEQLPWPQVSRSRRPLVAAPILDAQSGEVKGGFYLELYALSQPWSRRALEHLHPAVVSLTDQIASAYEQTSIYAQALEFQRVSQELRVAGSIQASLLPFSFPAISGWQLAVTLDPAGETSGDFYDIIPLEDGKIGIVVADVLDKGVGPALYMAISRTLIRTYALALESDRPELVLLATNQRILNDTQANMFVTVFYGVLDPATGRLTYVNAGHNPPYVFRSKDGHARALTRTGIPIGLQENVTWGRDSVTIQRGDRLVLYTDGIPEAQNVDEELFKAERLIESVLNSETDSAESVQKSILDAVRTFVGEAPQSDDITLMVLVRDEPAQ